MKNKETYKIDFGKVESMLYPKIDSSGARGLSYLRDSLDLGDNHKLDFSVSTKDNSPLQLNKITHYYNLDLSFNFRAGSENYFRVDNQGGHGFLHIHLQSGTQIFDSDRVPISENVSLSGLISYAFEKAIDTVKWKFPNSKLNVWSNFTGPIG